jgi:hypothetical protein
MGHRQAAALVIGILLAVAAVASFRGALVYPHDNSLELAAPPLDAPDRLSNRLFSDLSSTMVPELAVHLRDDQSSWLATWNPHVELGRPMFQVNGLSKAFLPTHLLFFVSSDPFVVHTLLVGLALVGIAAFGYGFCASQGLSPAACATAAITASLSIWLAFWSCFVMFLWGSCWMLALLWALARFLARASLANALFVVFAAHALALSSYPQLTVWALYLATTFTAVRLWQRDDPLAGKLRTAGQLAGLSLVALLSVAPVFADVALDAARSARGNYTPAFYLRWLPELASWRDAATFASRSFEAFWFGNPVSPDYPHPTFWGFSLGAPVAALAAASLLPRIARRAWGWQLACAICLLLTIWPEGYLFAVEHLGLSLSRWTPLRSAHVPVAILAAYTVEAIPRASPRERIAALALGCLPLLLALPGAVLQRADLQPSSLAVSGIALVATLAYLASARRAALALTLAAFALGYAPRMWLIRSADEIQRSSSLVETIAAQTPTGARFAKVGTQVIPPNQEGLLGLRSIHSYDSLAPRAFADWAWRQDGRGMINKRRRFPDLRNADTLTASGLARAGVGTLVSSKRLPRALGRVVGREARLWIHRNPEAPLLETQVAAWSSNDRGVWLAPGDRGDWPVTRIRDHSDRLVFSTTPVPRESLLFVSQQAHPHWRAFSGDEALATTVVDGLFLGVRLPPRTATVELRFLPWVRWSWIPQLGFVLLASGLAVRTIRRSRNGLWAGASNP